MPANKVIGTDQSTAAPCPIPARYVQLPTVWVNLFKQYFALPPGQDYRWLPSVAHLQYFDEQAELAVPLDPLTPISKEEDFANMIEIGRLEEYRGDRHTDLPKILVRRGGVSKTKIGIDHKNMAPINRQSTGDTYTHYYTMTIIAFAMSRDFGQADHLAAECEQLLSHFGPKIRKQFNLTVLNVSQVGEVGKLKEFPQFFVVPIVADIQYSDTVQLTAGGTPIRYFNFKLT